MEPVPETREAFDEILSVDELDPEQLLEALGSAVHQIIPQLTGLSLALLREQVTLTLAASTEEVAAFADAQHRLGEPPAPDGARSDGGADLQVGDPLDEGRWNLVARADTAAGVASTLSLPLRVGDAVVGSVHMYAATADAFAGHVDQLERLLGAAQASAVMNADLTFATRLEAVAAPQRLRENLTIDTAVGLIAGIRRISTEEADQTLRDDANRAGVHLVQAARVVVAALRRRR